MVYRPTILTMGAIVIGVIIAYLGAFIGYASSATDQYGDLLRFWAVATFVAIAIFGLVLAMSSGRTRIVCALLIATTLGLGFDPFYRLIEIGWYAP